MVGGGWGGGVCREVPREEGSGGGWSVGLGELEVQGEASEVIR